MAPDDDPRRWDRISSAFIEALELDPAARDAWLHELEQREPALAAEVRSLLASHDAASGFLTPPPAQPVPEPPPTAGPGDRLGPYRIVEPIGRGGMGVVYRAVRDDAQFTMDVAIKLIDPGMRSDEILKRFLSERQILAMLDHPNIARLIDGGTAPDGSPYLVMEYVAGRPLTEYCDAHQLSIDQRLALFLTVCDAVQFAHQRLVVHRDLKSDNILVTRDGSPRLLDFGIARLIAPDGAADGTLTAPMQRMLTPDYASPEQVRGDPVTVAGDVYSLGVVLYELLSGSRPLRFTTRTPEEILRVVTQEDPARPSVAVVQTTSAEVAQRRGDTAQHLRRRLAGDLDYVVLKALEKDVARRYGSVEQLAQDLRRHLDGRAVLARGGSAVYLMSRYARRHRVAVITSALVLLSLVAGLAGTAWQAGVAGRERDRATRRFNQVRGLAHAVVFDIHDAIANLPGSTAAREILVRNALVYLDSLSRDAGDDLALQHELGMAYGKIGDVQGRPMFPNLGHTEAALESYERSLALLRGVSAAQPESLIVLQDLIATSQRMADLLSVMGRKADALGLAEKTKQRIVAELARHPGEPMVQGDFSIACDRLSDMRFHAGDTLGALREISEALALNEKRFRARPGDPELRRGTLIDYAKQAGLLAARGDRAGAGATFLRAEALATEAVRALPGNTDASRDLSVVYGMRGQFLADGGEIDSALAVYGRGMQIAEDMAAADPKNALQQLDLAAGHFETGEILFEGRRYAQAEGEFGEAFARFGKLVAADSGNADNRTFMARSAHRAGEACRQLAGSAHGGEQARLRARAVTWLERSLALYRTLAQAGALGAEDSGALQQIEAQLAALGQHR